MFQKRVGVSHHRGYIVCYCAKNIHGDPLSLQGNCKIWQARLAGTVVGWALAFVIATRYALMTETEFYNYVDIYASLH